MFYIHWMFVAMNEWWFILSGICTLWSNEKRFWWGGSFWKWVIVNLFLWLCTQSAMISHMSFANMWVNTCKFHFCSKKKRTWSEIKPGWKKKKKRSWFRNSVSWRDLRANHKPLLLWNLDPFARRQAQVRRSWITKALIQALFCRLWSEVQPAVKAPELCFLRKEKKTKRKTVSTIAFVAQRRKCNLFKWFDLFALKGRRRGVFLSHASVFAGLVRPLGSLKYHQSCSSPRFSCLIAPLTVAVLLERLDVDQFQMKSVRWRRRHELVSSFKTHHDQSWATILGWAGRESSGKINK